MVILRTLTQIHSNHKSHRFKNEFPGVEAEPEMIDSTAGLICDDEAWCVLKGTRGRVDMACRSV